MSWSLLRFSIDVIHEQKMKKIKMHHNHHIKSLSISISCHNRRALTSACILKSETLNLSDKIMYEDWCLNLQACSQKIRLLNEVKNEWLSLICPVKGH